MGDDYSVSAHRKRDSASSSSPKALSLKDRQNDFSVVEAESLLPARESGDPGEVMHKIIDNKRVKDLSELEQTLTDPLLCVPPRAQLAIPGGFAYSETKLRPDAPAFTPESLTRCGPGARGIGEITDSVCGEPTIAHQPEIDDSCFVNIELDSSLVEDVDVPQPKRKRFSVSHPTEPKAFIRDSRDPIKEPGLKPFSLTPRLKRSGPRIQASEDSIQDNNESGPIAAVSDAIEPEITQDGPATGEPQIARGRWRIFRTSFFIANKIQIAVLIASITICCIIIIYVAV